MILLIDNYDSFTYNLYQYLGEWNEDIIVKRNDEMTVADIEALDPTAIVISPGPGRPEEAGISMEVIQTFYKTITHSRHLFGSSSDWSCIWWQM